jgi:hypothetical protein
MKMVGMAAMAKPVIRRRWGSLRDQICAAAQLRSRDKFCDGYKHG